MSKSQNNFQNSWFHQKHKKSAMVQQVNQDIQNNQKRILIQIRILNQNLNHLNDQLEKLEMLSLSIKINRKNLKMVMINMNKFSKKISKIL